MANRSEWLGTEPTRPNTRILELESRCAVIRTVGSNPTLSANFSELCLDIQTLAHH